MRQCHVLVNGVTAGVLSEYSHDDYRFTYDEEYRNNPTTPPVCLSMPKNQTSYGHDGLFPFFFNMLSEGECRKMHSMLHRIDEQDDFGILLATAQYDTIGNVTVKPITTIS